MDEWFSTWMVSVYVDGWERVRLCGGGDVECVCVCARANVFVTKSHYFYARKCLESTQITWLYFDIMFIEFNADISSTWLESDASPTNNSRESE